MGGMLLNIENFINQMMRKRNLTADALAKRLGYQNKAMLTRICKGKANLQSMQVFAERLREIIELTDEETRTLQDCVDYLRWQDDFCSVKEMQAFVQATAQDGAPLMLESVDDGATTTVFDRYANATQIRITLLNSQYMMIFEDLHRLIVEKNAIIEHFMLEDSNMARIIHAVNVLLKIIYEGNYHGYTMLAEDQGNRRAIYGSDVMTVSYLNEKGEQREDMIVLDAEQHGAVYSSEGKDGYAKLLCIPRKQYVPVKRTYLQKVAVDDYVAYSNICLRMEYNRAVYKIKPDFCLDFIAPDILLEAVKDSPAFANAVAGDLLNELLKIYQKRYQNIFEKRKPTHCICKREALWKFVKTGELSDHFWAMRPFTLNERIRILQTVLDQMRVNPYFHLYFMKDENYLCNMEIVCFEDHGIIIPHADTHYDLEAGHSEIMITHREFLRLYRDFFMQNLIQEQVISEEETCSILQQMIDACRSAQA